MIKTKEDLMNTYVKNPCEALETLYLTTCEGFGIKWRLGQQPTELQGYYRCFGVDKKTNSICVDVEGTELTLADFEPEEVVTEKVIPTKESLTGIKVRINDREQWDRMKELCESVGLEYATWQLCDFTDNTQGFMCGWEGKFLASCNWYDDEDTSDEFANLREVQYEDLFGKDEKELIEVISAGKYKYEKLITDSITELFGLFYKGELYSGITGHKQIKTVEGLLTGHSDGDIYTREEVKWQDEVLSYSPSCDNRHLAKFVLDYPEHFLEAARIALRATGELV